MAHEQSTNRRYEVGSLREFEEGVFRVLTVAGREVGVLRWKGELYAVRNVCPHFGAPICRGVVRDHLVAGNVPGSLELQPDKPVLICPWHRWEFDMQTGRSVFMPDYAVKTYQVVVSDDERVSVLLV
jgi:nitrite reductase (NADH) small subunit